MTTVFAVLVMILFGLLAVVRAMRWQQSVLSSFELERRAQAGDGDAQHELYRQKMRPLVMTLHRLWEFSLVAALTLSCIAAFGWGLGIVALIILLLLLGVVAQFKLVINVAQNTCWPRHEKLLLAFATKYPEFVKPFRGFADIEKSASFHLQSREELIDLLEHSDKALEADEKQLLGRTLEFKSRRVREVMTPRKDIVSIKKDEILGPLTLTALHKTGHSHLPVVHGGLDRIIGILPANEFMNTERQDELKVENVMRRQIFYLNEAQTLQEAMQALLRTKAHLFIVVDKYEKTVGIITLSDVVEALFGKPGNGKYQYEDVHAVANFGVAESETS